MALFGGLFGGDGYQKSADDMRQYLQAGLSYANPLIQAGRQQAMERYQQGIDPFAALSGTGTQGINQYGNLVGLGSMDPQAVSNYLQQTPGYQFNLQQGLQGIDRGAASRGMLTSGNTLNAEQQYGAGLASNTYQQALQALNPYFQLANVGAVGQGKLYGDLGNLLNTSLGNQANLGFNAFGAAGQAQGAADIAQANASNSLFGNILGLGTKLLGFGGAPAAGSLGAGIVGGLGKLFG